jgi:MFS transporter, DHA2 family, multidrug resistance protein
MLVSGLTMFLSAPVAGRIVRAIDMRLAMVAGFGLAAWGIQLGVRVTDEWGFWEFFTLQVSRGLGTMIAMIAAQQMSVSTLPVSMMKDASGLINLMRNVGGAIGLALLSTILTHQTAVHYADLAAAVTITNPQSQGMLEGLTQMMAAGGVADPEGAARKAMGSMLHRQASTLSFGDAFMFLALGCWAAVGLAFFAKPGKLGAGPGSAP